MKTFVHRIATIITAFWLILPIQAADSLTQDFNQASVSPLLIVPDGYVFGPAAQPADTVQNLNPKSYREFITTAATDYNEHDPESCGCEAPYRHCHTASGHNQGVWRLCS